MAKLKVGFYPYTYVRTNVMRSLLLKRAEYDKLLKMSVAEITKYLQDNGYKKEINALGGSLQSAELIELALTQNLDRSFRKLKRISQDDLLVLVDAYLERYDVQNAKTVLRAVQSGQDTEEAEILISDAGSLPAEYYRNALKAESIKEAVEMIRENRFVSNGEDLLTIENRMDKEYYNMLWDLAERIPSAINLFKQFIQAEIDTVNIMIVLRLKRTGASAEVIRSLLIRPDRFFDRIIALPTVADVLEYLEKSQYGTILEPAIDDFKATGSLIAVENALTKVLLRKSITLLHKDMLSVNVILGFMFAKEIEVRNLRVLVKGKKFGFEEDVLRKEIIV